MKKVIVTKTSKRTKQNKKQNTQKRGICVRESNACKTLTLKESLQIFHNIGSARDKMLEADLQLERIIIIYQSIQKMPVPYYMLHGKRMCSNYTSYFFKK